MDIQAEKIELAKLVLSTNNLVILQSVKQLFVEEETHDFWNELSPQQQMEIKEASLEIEEGKTTDYELFMAKHR